MQTRATGKHQTGSSDKQGKGKKVPLFDISTYHGHCADLCITTCTRYKKFVGLQFLRKERERERKRERKRERGGGVDRNDRKQLKTRALTSTIIIVETSCSKFIFLIGMNIVIHSRIKYFPVQILTNDVWLSISFPTRPRTVKLDNHKRHSVMFLEVSQVL
eukprot:sb/3472817/